MTSPRQEYKTSPTTRPVSSMCPLKYICGLLLIYTLHVLDGGAWAWIGPTRLNGLVDSITKSASLGGQQVLNCHVPIPKEKTKLYALTWNKAGLSKPVYMRYANYLPQVNQRFKDRLKIIRETSLEISHIRTQDEGWYECSITPLKHLNDSKNGNKNDNVNGTWVYLNVNIPPRIVVCSPQSLHHRQGETIELFCNASGSPEPVLTWNKDGKPLLSSSRIRIEGYKVIIRNVHRSDAGVYMGTFSNTVGSVSQLINLVVEGAAYIMVPPENMTAIEGQRIKFQCGAMAYPSNITYNWFKDNENIKFLPDYGDRIKTFEGGNLVITSVIKNDMGWYTCHPTNGIGEDPKASAFLNVTYPPYFTIRPKSIYQAEAGQSVTIPCEAEGTPKPVIAWRRVNGEINWDSRVVKNGGNLTIYKLTKEDHGDYECVATNQITSIVIGTRLIIEKTTPHAPYNVTVVTSLFTAKVEWMPAYDGGLEQSYVIWFRCTNLAEQNWQTIRVPPGDKTSFIVYSLEADTVYEFMVLARNSLGDGLYSDHVFAKTLGYHDDLPTGLPTKPNGATYIPPVVRPIGPRPKPPVNVTVKLLNGAVNITWSAPEKSNISIFYYVIEYCNSTIWRRLEDVVLTPKTWFVMRDLRPGTYKYRVFSFSLLSYSQPQESEEINIPEGPVNEDDTSGHPDASFSALPVPAIGGIVGGLAFLLIAVILAIIAVIISKRKQKKKAKKYGNVKYFEPDQVDSSRNIGLFAQKLDSVAGGLPLKQYSPITQDEERQFPCLSSEMPSSMGRKTRKVKLRQNGIMGTKMEEETL